MELKFKDITNQCEFGENDDEFLPLLKCACGKRFYPWSTILSIYEQNPFQCTCGRKLLFQNEVKIYEILD